MGSVTRCGGQDRENTRKGNEMNDKRIKGKKERRERKREIYRKGERVREQMRVMNGERGRAR